MKNEGIHHPLNTLRISSTSNGATVSNLPFVTALALILLAFGALPALAQSGARYALVIGNSEYEGLASLRNPVNDVSDMAAALKRLGFEVDLRTNADLPQMEEGVLRLSQRLATDKQAMGIFYYAGHGVQSQGSNYLIPSRTGIMAEAFLRSKALSAQTVLELMQSAGNNLNLVFLDACRDNPFGWARSGQRGLSVVGNQPPGSVIVYATSAGSTASDGGSRNGVFTGELLKHIETPGLDLNTLLDRTAMGVLRATNNTQNPAVYKQFFDVAYLKPAASEQTPAASQQAATPAAAPRPAFAVDQGSLRISAVEAVTVLIDGAEQGSLFKGQSATLTLDAGEREVLVRYANGHTESNRVIVRPGSVVEVAFSYKPVPVTTPPAAPGIMPSASTIGQSWTSPSGLKFMAVPGGSFHNGTSQVALSPFWMAATEVTQGQWQAVMGSNPAHASYGIGTDHPVNNISWYDALVFCNRLSIKDGRTPVYSIGGSTDPDRWGAVPTSSNDTWNGVTMNPNANGYRLPTEAEWEYAARGGEAGARQTVAYAGGNEPGAVAWFSGNSGNKTQPVGRKQPNQLGLFDMSGNVWEWCWDWYGGYSTNSLKDPTGAALGTLRVYRGGSFDFSASYCAVSNRLSNDPYFRFEVVGFRVVSRP